MKFMITEQYGVTISTNVIVAIAIIIISVQQLIIFWQIKKNQEKQDDLLDRLSAKNTSEYAEMLAFRRKIGAGNHKTDDEPEKLYDEKGNLVSEDELQYLRSAEEVIGV